MSTITRYPDLHQSGELRRRADRLAARYVACDLCPHACGTDRAQEERGVCGASTRLRISGISLHFGEETPISGSNGSGTIFFSHCSLACQFCQNHEISQLGTGQPFSILELAEHMCRLQSAGAHNINLVTPTHYLPGILSALDHAAAGGLSIPVVYNTSGWERVHVLKELEGIVDIYMPDFKYSDPNLARTLSGAYAYPATAQSALVEMARQTGPLQVSEQGIATRGLLVRHLVLPGNLDNTYGILDLIEHHVPESTLSILSQYHPSYRAVNRTDDLSRFLNQEERQAIAERLSRSPLRVIRQWH